jgi:PAS domain S-box-containing protein
MDRRRKTNDPGPLAHSSHLRTALSWIALSVLIGQSVILLSFLRPETANQLIFLSTGILLVLAALLLNYRGRTELAGGLIAISLTIMVTMLGTYGAGIRDVGVIAYPAILIIASLLLRRNTSLLLTVFVLACLAWLVFGEIYGWYQPQMSAQIQARHFLITAVVIILTAFAVQTISLTVRNNTIALNHELDERRRVEKALREAEELYRNMVEKTSVITYRDTADEEGETIYISPQISDILGYSQDEWRDDPKLWLKITHPQDYAKAIASIKDCLANGKAVFEYRMAAKGGEWRWFQDESVLIRDEEGKPQYIHGVLIDITERKIAEQKVSQRDAILSAVANTTQKLLKAANWRDEIDGILKLLGEATGASHVYIFENYKEADGTLYSSQKYEWTAPGMKSELDNPVYQNAQVIPSTPGLEDWYANLSNGLPFYGSGKQYPEYWKKVFEPRGLKTLLDVPIYVNEEWWGTIGFDDYLNEMPWSQVETDALVAAAGNLGTAIERQQADLALRISEEKFQLAFHHTHVAMAINRSSDNTLLDVNNAFCKITGYSREDAIGKRAGRDLHIWADPQDRDTIFKMLEQQGHVDEFQGRFRRKNGEIGIGLLSVINISIAGEACQLYTFYDISRIDQLLNELRTKNEELQSFTYTVSHDLKAPLVTISGFMGYLEQDARKGDLERLNKDILRINEAVVKMQRLINELLELSRIGRLMNPPEEVSFGEIVREALELVEGRLKTRQVQVEVEADLPSVCGDRARLVEVVQNLVDNAVKFMGDQAEPLVEIGVERSRNLAFFVRDNGAGIDPEQHERVFGLFNKLDARTEGTGIGLALVKRIVEVHGGKVWVESEGAGKGSTFYFTLADCRESGGKHDG